MDSSARTLLTESPRFPEPEGFIFRGQWPAHWIATPGFEGPSFVCAYRLKFEIKEQARIRIHVSADQRYELFLDGHRLGRGPERGDPFHWCYESYDLNLKPGRHLLVSRVWTLAPGSAPNAQLTVQHGFLLAAEAPPLDGSSQHRQRTLGV